MLAADRLVYATVPCLYHRWQRSVYSPGASYVIEVVTNFRGCRLPTAAVSSSMIRTQACRNSGNRYIADVIVRHRNPRLSAWCEAHVAGVNIDAKVHESAPGGTLPCVSRSLLSLRGDAGAKDPAFASRKGRPPDRAPSMVWSSAQSGRPASTRPYHRTGCATRTARMPSTGAPRCPRCSRRWATATSPPHQVNCAPDPTRRAACTWIRECSFDENRGSELMKLESAPETG